MNFSINLLRLAAVMCIAASLAACKTVETATLPDGSKLHVLHSTGGDPFISTSAVLAHRCFDGRPCESTNPSSAAGAGFVTAIASTAIQATGSVVAASVVKPANTTFAPVNTVVQRATNTNKTATANNTNIGIGLGPIY